MSLSKQQNQIEAALDAVNWSDLASMSEQSIANRWRNDQDASWPDATELADFKVIKTRKRHQAAE